MPQYITPDVIVDQKESGDYDVRLEDGRMPRLYISPMYTQLMSTHAASEEERDYIRKKIQSARWLIDAIEQRRDTLLRISREIFRVQREFLDHGIKFLRPLKMRTVAERTNVHVSTVSRAVAEKYAQTPRGIFPLKFFFTGGTKAADGEEESRKSVRQRVLDAIEKEDKQRPLSDGEIAKMLQSKGLDIARRTVTKYRKAMGIPTSRRRRAY
jgi:RNA polymerase sigma-54 factor